VPDRLHLTRLLRIVPEEVLMVCGLDVPGEAWRYAAADAVSCGDAYGSAVATRLADTATVSMDLTGKTNILERIVQHLALASTVYPSRIQDLFPKSLNYI
jgi:hypothetical protein